jgi:hypothetical protein
MKRMDDISAITQLVLHERQARDRGWWDQMAACYHPDSTVSLSWLQASGAEFTARSRKMSESGLRAVHRPGAPSVHLEGDRAVTELPVVIEFRTTINGVEADCASYCRLLYKVERRDGAWKIKSLTCIYERDTLFPVVAGAALTLDEERLAAFRAPYRFLAYLLSLAGHSIRDDLYGDDRPALVQTLYGEVFAWLREKF